MAESRDRLVPELLGVALVLIAGAVLRYWLSTVLPFDAGELSVIEKAGTPSHGLRVPFIMVNGLSLLALYLYMRRSAGVSAAVTALLLLQTNLAFQEQALRIRFVALPVLLGLVALCAWRHRRPARRLPPGFAGLLLALALFPLLRGIWIGVTLPDRLAEIERDTSADPQRVWEALRACGGDVVTPLERLQDCEPASSGLRSLRQQELLLVHRHRLSGTASVWDGRLPAPPAGTAGRVAVFDPAAAAFLVTEAGEPAETALRIVRTASPGFFEAILYDPAEEALRDD